MRQYASCASIITITIKGIARALSVLLMAGSVSFFALGCGRPPCFEGALEIGIGEALPGATTCSFEILPERAVFLIRTTKRSKKYKVPHCRVKQTIFVELPEDVSLMGYSRKTVVPVGTPIAELEDLVVAKEGCGHHLSGVLSMNKKYEDFEDAYRGHAEGDEQAFYVTFDDRGVGECPEFGIPLNEPRSCAMAYRLNVSQLDLP